MRIQNNARPDSAGEVFKLQQLNALGNPNTIEQPNLKYSIQNSTEHASAGQGTVTRQLSFIRQELNCCTVCIM